MAIEVGARGQVADTDSLASTASRLGFGSFSCGCV